MAFEDDVIAAKASGRPFRVVLAKDGKQVAYLTAEEIAETVQRRKDADAKQAEKATVGSAIFSVAAALDPLPSPYSQDEVNAKVEELVSLLRLLYPDLVRNGLGKLR